MMLELLLAGSLLSAVNVDVLPLERPAAQGALVELTSEKLVIEADGKQTSYDVAELVSVAAVKPQVDGAAPEMVVGLIDGSSLVCTSYTTSAGRAAIALSGGDKIEIPTASIRYVRLRRAEAALAEQWAAIESRAATGDRIVIRKLLPMDVVALDSLEGVLFDVTDAVANFKVNDTMIPVKREKLDGLFYFHAALGAPADPACQVVDASGSRWNASSVTLRGDKLQLTGTTGVKATLPLDRLVKLDFSTGKIVYLADAEPEASVWTSYFDSGTALPSLQQWFAPQKNRGFAGGKLTLPNPDDSGKPKQYDKGLAVHSRTELSYRVPEDFKRLLATAGIDMKVRPAGHVHLVVSGDGRKLLEEDLTGKDPQPLKIDLDISGVRRLTILVDYGEDADIADHLNLCNARITK
jgi:hypothetical protein